MRGKVLLLNGLRMYAVSFLLQTLAGMFYGGSDPAWAAVVSGILTLGFITNSVVFLGWNATAAIKGVLEAREEPVLGPLHPSLEVSRKPYLYDMLPPSVMIVHRTPEPRYVRGENITWTDGMRTVMEYRAQCPDQALACTCLDCTNRRELAR